MTEIMIETTEEEYKNRNYTLHSCMQVGNLCQERRSVLAIARPVPGNVTQNGRHLPERLIGMPFSTSKKDSRDITR